MDARKFPGLVKPIVARERHDDSGVHDGGLDMSKPLVSVVDDSESVRESLPDLLQDAGFAVQAFSSAEAFLASTAPDDTSCLILDVGLPGMSGPDLQQELKRLGRAIPIVFITAQGDKSLHPRLVGQGAVACLFKPFSDTALLEAIESALGAR
jgi:FixJ family two-component response regulator